MAASIKDQITEVKRELHTRARVFPRWVAQGRLEQAEADRRTERMEAVLATLYAEQARQQPSLFPDR